MVGAERAKAAREEACPGAAARLNTLCSATFDSERFWREPNEIRLPALSDPVQERIVSTLDELLFPFCPGDNDVLLTRRSLPPSQRDYLRSLGFHFENRVMGGQEPKPAPRSGDEPRYCYSPYAVLPDWESTVAGWQLVNAQPSFQAVRKVNSKIYSWRLRGELTGMLGEACFTSAEVGAAAGEILDSGRKALVKEAYGVSGRGSVLVEGRTALDRICRHIEKGEKKGGAAAFVVEPLLNRKEDFSCHFWLEENGALNLFGVQRMRNRGLGFHKVETAGADLIEPLEKNGYFRVVEQVGKALSADGYFGPVCLDSMLTGEGITPIVEINARKSMGLINLRLNAQLGMPSARGGLSFYNLRAPEGFSHQALLEGLENRGLLFGKAKGAGVAVLNANGITVNLEPAEPSNPPGGPQGMVPPARAAGAGRVYFSVFSANAGEEAAMEQGFADILQELGVKVL